MIDIELIKSDPTAVRAALQKRSNDVDLDTVLEADARRREIIQTLEGKRAERNSLSRSIGKRLRSGDGAAELESRATELRDEINALTAELDTVDEQLRHLLMQLPNVPDDRVPAGGKENNQVIRTWGEKPVLEYVRDHVELSTALGLVDYARGAKLGGSGFWIYRGNGAALEWAMLDFFCREHIKDGYEFVLPPHLLLDECGFATGQFPKFYDDVYHLDPHGGERQLFLLPTAETALLNVYRDELLDEESLPIKMFGYTPCYRRESGSHRTDERGTVRGHQFNKVEIFQFVTPEEADKALTELIRKAESLVEQLGLHYRTSLLAAKDASASMAITYDVEVWLPSLGGYKEVSSASSARDYQSRRGNIRFRRAGKKRSEYVYTLNASALATSRLVPAVLEQCQQPDGSVVVPTPLRAWLGTDVLSAA